MSLPKYETFTEEYLRKIDDRIIEQCDRRLRDQLAMLVADELANEVASAECLNARRLSLRDMITLA